MWCASVLGADALVHATSGDRGDRSDRGHDHHDCSDQTIKPLKVIQLSNLVVNYKHAAASTNHGVQYVPIHTESTTLTQRRCRYVQGGCECVRGGCEGCPKWICEAVDDLVLGGGYEREESFPREILPVKFA